MQILLYLTDFIVPLVIFGIVGYGLLMKVPVYDTFIKGAKKGFLTVIKIMPTLVGLMVAVGILRASGFLELIANGIGRFTDRIGFPGAGSAYSGKDVLLIGGDGTFAGHF